MIRHSDDAFRFGYQLGEHARGIGEKDLDSLPDAQVWLNLNSGNPETDVLLSRLGGVPLLARQALMTSNPRPRFFQTGDGVCLVLRGVNLNEGADRDDMISVRIWVSKNLMITCHERDLRSISSAAHGVEAGDYQRLSEVLRALIDYLVELIDQEVDELTNVMNTLENIPEHELTHSQESMLSELRKQAIVMLRYLGPQRGAIERLQQCENLPIRSPDLHHTLDTLVRNLEDLQLAKEQAIAILDARYAILAREQNHRLFILSIVAAIFLPMTFVTGLLGMNVGGIPGASVNWAFWAIVAASAGMAGGLWAWFKRGSWL